MKKYLNFDNIFATVCVILFISSSIPAIYYNRPFYLTFLIPYIILFILTTLIYYLNKYRFKNFSDIQKIILYTIFIPLFAVVIIVPIPFVADNIIETRIDYLLKTKHLNIVKDIKNISYLKFDVEFENDEVIYYAIINNDYQLLNYVSQYQNISDVYFFPATSYSDKKLVEKNLKRIISKMPEVSKVKVKFNNSKKEIKELKDTGNLGFTINVEIYKSADKLKVERIINKLLPKFAERQINISVKPKK